jgi:undecaprenyl-diphosphatase
MPPATSRLPSTLVMCVAGILLVVLLAVLVSVGATDSFDQLVIEALRDPALDEPLAWMAVVTELGSTWAVMIVAAITFAVGVAVGPWRHGLAGALTILLAAIGNSAFKLAMARERPDLLDPLVAERGFSFPSGHATTSMVAYGVLAVLIGRSRLPRAVRLSVAFVLGVLVGLIGISRVWLGVHYPTDVLAGWLVGGVVVLAYAELTRRVSPEPAVGAVDADRAAPRSDRPAAG